MFSDISSFVHVVVEVVVPEAILHVDIIIDGNENPSSSGLFSQSGALSSLRARLRCPRMY